MTTEQTFTQTEVDKIVTDRLTRERRTARNTAGEVDDLTRERDMWKRHAITNLGKIEALEKIIDRYIMED